MAFTANLVEIFAYEERKIKC